MAARAIAGAALLLLLAACASAPKWPAKATAFGGAVETTVDSPIARYYLESYLAGSRTDAAMDARIDAIHRRHAGRPTREELAGIARATSTDFAALFLAQRLLDDECNRRINAELARELSNPEPVANASRYVVLFAPGWDYVALGSVTGADFARPRALAARQGFAVELSAFAPNGSIEANARLLAADIARLARSGRRIILASASTGGPAVHVALAELASDAERAAVAGWLNIGGLLQGSPIVEHLLAWPRRPFFEAGLVWTGWDRDAIVELGTTRGRERFARLRLDPSLRVVDYVAIPLSGHIGPHARSNYPVLAQEGPNDGLTLLADAMAPGSLSIVAFGFDHFVADDPRIDAKAVALMKVMVRLAEGAPGERCPPAR